MAEKANIIVDYDETWFEENWWAASLFCATNMKKGCTVDRVFARFQVQEDADKFKEFQESTVS